MQAQIGTLADDMEMGMLISSIDGLQRLHANRLSCSAPG